MRKDPHLVKRGKCFRAAAATSFHLRKLFPRSAVKTYTFFVTAESKCSYLWSGAVVRLPSFVSHVTWRRWHKMTIHYYFISWGQYQEPVRYQHCLFPVLHHVLNSSCLQALQDRWFWSGMIDKDKYYLRTLILIQLELMFVKIWLLHLQQVFLFILQFRAVELTWKAFIAITRSSLAGKVFFRQSNEGNKIVWFFMPSQGRLHVFTNLGKQVEQKSYIRWSAVMDV